MNDLLDVRPLGRWTRFKRWLFGIDEREEIGLEAALATIRLLAAHLDLMESRLINLGSLSKRSDLADRARKFADRIETEVCRRIR